MSLPICHVASFFKVKTSLNVRSFGKKTNLFAKMLYCDHFLIDKTLIISKLFISVIAADYWKVMKQRVKDQ